jgi:hypothetical protein
MNYILDVITLTALAVAIFFVYEIFSNEDLNIDDFFK